MWPFSEKEKECCSRDEACDDQLHSVIHGLTGLSLKVQSLEDGIRSMRDQQEEMNVRFTYMHEYIEKVYRSITKQKRCCAVKKRIKEK